MRMPFGTRRDFLSRHAQGFGMLALSALWSWEGDRNRGVRVRAGEVGGGGDGAAKEAAYAPAAPKVALRPGGKAKSVIFLYMDGGPSQVDTFDYKPLLRKYHGRDPHDVFKVEPTQFANVGKVMDSPWEFARRGESGLWVSSLFPHLSQKMDDLCIIHSLTSKFPEHTSANYFLHSGSGLQGRPSMGAWVTYGLGSENADLPGFVVIHGGLIPPGGLDNFASGFLPADFQGSLLRPGDVALANINRLEPTQSRQRTKLDLARSLDALDRRRHEASPAPELEAAIRNAETAYRMQTAVPLLTDLAKETAATRELYGMNAGYEPTKIFARECLLARRLVERGVRFVEVTCPNLGHDRWDQHANLKKGHEDNARAVDQPIAGLLADLKSRGLWEDVLVVWAGEFGRTPFAQGADGRDHNPFGYTIWMAGGGVKGGMTYGQTDEWGYKAIHNRLEIHDLHATMLHLLGVDHTRLTFRFGGRDMRLTDVHGRVITEILKA